MMRRRREVAQRVALEQRARTKKRSRSLLARNLRKLRPRNDHDLDQMTRARPPKSQSLQGKKRSRRILQSQRSVLLTMLSSQSFLVKKFLKGRQSLASLNEVNLLVKPSRKSLISRRKQSKSTRRNMKANWRNGQRNMRRKATTLMMMAFDQIKKL